MKSSQTVCMNCDIRIGSDGSSEKSITASLFIVLDRIDYILRELWGELYRCICFRDVESSRCGHEMIISKRGKMQKIREIPAHASDGKKNPPKMVD